MKKPHDLDHVLDALERAGLLDEPRPVGVGGPDRLRDALYQHGLPRTFPALLAEMDRRRAEEAARRAEQERLAAIDAEVTAFAEQIDEIMRVAEAVRNPPRVVVPREPAAPSDRLVVAMPPADRRKPDQPDAGGASPHWFHDVTDRGITTHYFLPAGSRLGFLPAEIAAPFAQSLAFEVSVDASRVRGLFISSPGVDQGDVRGLLSSAGVPRHVDLESLLVGASPVQLGRWRETAVRAGDRVLVAIIDSVNTEKAEAAE